MKGAVLAPPRQEILVDNNSSSSNNNNRSALSPRNTSGNGNAEETPSSNRKRGMKKGSSKRSSSASATMTAANMDPWSDANTSSPNNNNIPPPPPPPPPPPASETPQTTKDDEPLLETSRPRSASKGNSSRGTMDSNPVEPKAASVLPGSPSPTRRQHRLKEAPNSTTPGNQSIGSQPKERPTDASGVLPLAGAQQQRRMRDPIEQEQALFEQRLCEDAYGVAVRKINQYGKANLRYVKCVHVDDLNETGSSKRSLSSRSASSKGRKKNSSSSQTMETPRKDPQAEKARHALVWGKKKDVQITLDHFTAVRVGKVTERARRNPSPPSRILSLLTNDPKHPALDIEAPTRMDRDKFARAFARFLDVPLEGEDTHSVHSAEFTPVTHKTTPEASASSSAPGDLPTPDIRLPVPHAVPTHSEIHSDEKKEEDSTPPVTPNELQQQQKKDEGVGGFWQGAVAAANAAHRDPSYQSASNHTGSNDGFNLKAVVELPNEKEAAEEDNKDNESVVSSLTGHGYDQELVEELHNALNELRVELEDSRAEAARAVKVAEQAIQSAEKTSSQDWHNTVTHKAAEAAAQAQKRSAEAMAKQRLAEERLEGERRTAAFWRKQAEVAEEEAGLLQTRAATAEVRKAAIEEQLESERRMANTQIDCMKDRISQLETSQLDALNVAVQKSRDLEIELEATKKDLANSKERVEDVENAGDTPRNGARRKKSIMGRKKKNDKASENASTKTLLESKTASSPEQTKPDSANQKESTSVSADQLEKLKAETALVREQYELLRRTATAELSVLPEISKKLTDQVAGTLDASQEEIKRLRDRLAAESASRRKLLNEVQDLRGIVRVYCRPRPPAGEDNLFNTPSQETLVLRRDAFEKGKKSQPMSFEFDRIFEPNLPQQDVYGEVQEVCLGVLDGFNITVMAFGQEGCGKTRSVLGEISSSDGTITIEEHGIQLQALKQLFTIAGHRSERFKDTFSMSIVEVHDERLSDLLAGTTSGDKKGQFIVADSSSRRKSQKQKYSEDDASSGKTAKLEIRSDLHGETVVQGALHVEVDSFDEVIRTWEECIGNRRQRLEEQEVDVDSYESSSHVITTLKVTSANIATGHGVVGKLQFVDMASAELAPPPSETETKDPETSSPIINSVDDWRFANKSLDTLGDVVVARSQFVRSVPYRNSTLTHLLRDSLDGDTKVIFLACVSSDPTDIQESTATLRLASRMRQVTIGKATKHALTSP